MYGNLYRESELTITNNQIFALGEEVMGDWETPLMKRTSEIVRTTNGNYLEIGFGLGIFSTNCWSPDMESYTIVEIHNQILPYLYQWAKDKPNVRIIEGDWFDNIELINDRIYDGIYFDTHMDDNRPEFRNLVVNSQLKEGGIFSYFTMGDGDVFNYVDKLNLENVTLTLPSVNRSY
jgi:hypothetical protein